MACVEAIGRVNACPYLDGALAECEADACWDVE
jgi:hypothetical protein